MRAILSKRGVERNLRKFIRRNRELQKRIEETLALMEEDVFAPSLGSHRLSGEFYGLWACSCGYGCRIIFSVQHEENAQSEYVVLHNIGTHDRVY